MSQTSWRPAHEERIANGRCHHPGCNVAPSIDHVFMACSACKVVAYCGLECQRAHWKFHKLLCKHMQRDKAMTDAKDSIRPWASSLPPLKERINLLRDFIEAHSRAFQKAIHCEILLRGGVDNFNFKRHYMGFDLRLRSDCGGNPGVAFTVENAAIRPLSEIGAVAAKQAALDAGRATRDANEAHFRATEKDFVGLFMALYRIEGYNLWQPYSLHRTPTFDGYLRQLHPEMWLRELQGTVEMGLVFRKTSPDDPVQKYGRIKKVGSGWNWVQLTSQVLVQFGMPGDCPGLLF